MELQIGSERWPLLLRPRADRSSAIHELTLGQRRLRLAVYAHGERVAVFAPEASAVLRQIDAIAHAGEGAAEVGRLSAPMPGKVIAYLVKLGESVSQGQALAVMEAMKMEHTLNAPRDGVVAELMYSVGDQVAEGGELLRLQD